MMVIIGWTPVFIWLMGPNGAVPCFAGFYAPIYQWVEETR